MQQLKATSLFVLMILASIIANAQSGVTFLANGNLRAVFENAKAEKKLVFLEVYAPDCSHCLQLEAAFKDAKVAKFYNEHFTSYKMDMYKVETQAFLQKQKVYVSTTPTLLFYNADVKIIYQVTLTESRLTAAALLEEAKKVVK